MTSHRHDCPCRTCELRSEWVAIKTQWCWAMSWRLDPERGASEYGALVDILGTDAETGQA